MCGRWQIFEGHLELFCRALIIVGMRRLVLIVMVLLLPLRGWAGAVMAVDMLAQNAANPSAVYSIGGAAANLDKYAAATATAEKAAFTSGPDGTSVAHGSCPGHADMAAAEASDADTNNRCDTCFSCQICHSVALASVMATTMTPNGTASPSQGGASHFASAELVGGFKPPIS